MTTTLERPAILEPIAARSAVVPEPKQEHRGTAVRLALLVAVGGVLRFWGLGASRLSYDETFTAMAGRLPVGSLFNFLRLNDSHPPLDYLLRAPLARAGLNELWFRMPSAILSLGALALFAWWMRSRGRAGLIATALLAVSSFQVSHAREARMYAELEFLGVAIAVLATAWYSKPRRWHAPLLGVLVFVGLLTHVSMFLLAAGVLALPGRRTDREAWRWRAAIVLGGLGWALVWGSTFLTQAGGGHSAWIPPTTLSGLGSAISRLVTFEPTLVLVVAAATIAGGVTVWRRNPTLGRVWTCCFAVPVALAAVAGLVEPVVLDRTFTLMAWAPCLAIAWLLDALASRRRILGLVAVLAVFAVIVPSTLRGIQTPSGPDTPLRQLALVARPGDIVAVRPATKSPELAWSLGVRGRAPTRPVAVPGLPKAFGMQVGTGRPSGRIWLLDWRPIPHPRFTAADQCAPRWSWGHTHIQCVRARPGVA